MPRPLMRASSNEHRVAIFGGRSNPALANKIAEAYGTTLGDLSIRDFADGEIYVRFEESIRGADLFIIQSTHPKAENWMELLLLIDAAKRASAERVTAVIPYFGYARQERKDQPRVSIAAKLMANMLTSAGVDRILTMELHAAQIQGFFDVPVDHLYGSTVLTDHVRQFDLDDFVVLAPDVGGLKMARAYAQRLGVDLALIDKRRPRQNEARVMNVIGDVEGKDVLIIDDIVDTAGTLTRAAKALKDHGALKIMAACTHGLLSGPAYDRIENSPLERLMITDTVPLKRPSDCIEVVSVSNLFAKAIRHIYTDRSVSTLFTD
ncbi:ribose-phosphate pyrophosphokinase [Salinibacter ruber]|uniref:Ribose-phosphate pyrophosphokinase n=2 Tax=Salinibacter ruber TaxID=146919 RepID=A0A9X2U9F8_9BACT|nr:ribose-phosphate pyrophosphokinase [Salinibacter ruber]MCS3952225.1 ribose-phosphate pyrophosphokinase [Salinibacter ruber]MCS4154857.1 ribose-phosphate pyrophosphokinase [Salinibacter ruber]MCS4186637.1 ribose-phosphate pyrophosphokinase [Salinibacter ruber]